MRPMPVAATKGCASCSPYEKSWRRGVVWQRNRLVDNELTRQTPAPNPLANLAQGGRWRLVNLHISARSYSSGAYADSVRRGGGRADVPEPRLFRGFSTTSAGVYAT